MRALVDIVQNLSNIVRFVVGMMVLWVTEIRGTCPAPYRTADAGLDDSVLLRTCRIDSGGAMAPAAGTDRCGRPLPG